MPILQDDLNRDPMRRESADADDQVEGQMESESALPTAMSSPPDQTEHSCSRRRHLQLHLHHFHLDPHPHPQPHYPHRHPQSPQSPQSPSIRRSEESRKTEPYETPLLPPALPSPIPLPSPSPPPPPSLDWTRSYDDSPSPSPSPATYTYTYKDRAGLIERLKRGEPLPCIPHRYHFDSPWSQQQPPVTPARSPPRTPTSTSTSTTTTTTATTTTTTNPPTLLPPLAITPGKEKAPSDDERRYQDGMKIERPRSALHSGDFTHEETSQRVDSSHRPTHAFPRQESVNSSHSWIATSPPRDFVPLNFGRSQPLSLRSDEVPSSLHSLSSSLSTSFVYKPPTSPLFQFESSDDADRVSAIDGINLAHNVARQRRRHTVLSPLSGVHGHSPSSLQKQSSSLRQERTFPYQAHQPRRSLASAASLSISGSSPQTPACLRSRRLSSSSDVSPLQHASMVGSYEESILRGRMSTTPSRPLDFLAQIGVLGLGKCKASLRCPPHVTLPFPAVFYSYASSSHGRSKEDDGPSPYVGQIDVENGLPSQGDDVRSRRKHQTRTVESAADEGAMDTYHANANLPSRDVRKAQRAGRSSGSPRAPPGGSYRIPEKGQIQIIIKNPNKTAVKLFLVPYDLTGMEPGTKTFVRQRSYSNGPIIDNMPDLKGSLSADHPILRYLVHLHICCPSRGRFYLYKNIRVVFANRVPDGKEKLRNEITLPEPKFTPYKAIRAAHQPLSKGTGPGASLAAGPAFRRQSSGPYYDGTGRAVDVVQGFVPPSPTGHPLLYGFASDHNPVEPAFRFSASQARESMEEDVRSILGGCPLQSLKSSHAGRPITQDSNNMSNWVGYNSEIDKYDKLNKGDVGYGGNAFAGLINGNPAVAKSLLSQRLRSLGVQISDRGEGEEFLHPTED